MTYYRPPVPDLGGRVPSVSREIYAPDLLPGCQHHADKLLASLLPTSRSWSKRSLINSRISK